MSDESQVMQCMEVWGGNEPVDAAVSLAGLDAWVYSKPYGQSSGGGDVYYLSSCATGRITRLLLADVSGHGQAVATVAIELRRLMRRYVNFIDQTSFVKSMNAQFAAFSDAGTFATAIASTFFAPTNDLTLCIAGHPPPLRYRAKTRAWAIVEEQEQTNIPLGIDDSTDWRQFGVRLDVKDLVLVYSDALMESKGRDGEMLGVAGLLQAASDVSVADPKQFVPKLLEHIASLHPGNLDGDDVSTLLISPTGDTANAGIGTAIKAQFHVAGTILRALIRRDGPVPWPEISIPNIGGMLIAPLNRLWSRKNHTAPRG